MTKIQKNVLIKVYNELKDTFPHIVIIVSEKEQLDNSILPDPSLFWHGGYVAARYLISDAVDKISRRKFNRISPEQIK